MKEGRKKGRERRGSIEKGEEREGKRKKKNIMFTAWENWRLSITKQGMRFKRQSRFREL